MKTKFKILIAFMAIFLVNYSSWGQRRIGSEIINLTSIADREVIKFISGTNPQVKNDYASSVLLAYPASSGVSAVTVQAGSFSTISYAGGYSAGSPASKTFFIIFFPSPS